MDLQHNAAAPTEWTFALSARLYSPTATLLLKAAIALTQEPAIFR